MSSLANSPIRRSPGKAAPKGRQAAPSKRVSAKVQAKAPSNAPVPARKPAAEVSQAAAQPPRSKQKPVRDSFTMPESDFALVGHLKERTLGFKRPVKKSELLRAGLHALAVLSDAELRKRLDALVPLKAGRPKKSA
jgi:hypothetical protein